MSPIASVFVNSVVAMGLGVIVLRWAQGRGLYPAPRSIQAPSSKAEEKLTGSVESPSTTHAFAASNDWLIAFSEHSAAAARPSIREPLALYEAIQKEEWVRRIVVRRSKGVDRGWSGDDLEEVHTKALRLFRSYLKEAEEGLRAAPSAQLHSNQAFATDRETEAPANVKSSRLVFAHAGPEE